MLQSMQQVTSCHFGHRTYLLPADSLPFLSKTTFKHPSWRLAAHLSKQQEIINPSHRITLDQPACTSPGKLLG